MSAFALRDLALVIRHLRDVSLDITTPGRLRTPPRRPRPGAPRPGRPLGPKAPGRSPHPGPTPAIATAPAAAPAARPAPHQALEAPVPPVDEPEAPGRPAQPATPSPRRANGSSRNAAGSSRRRRPQAPVGGVAGHDGEVWWAAAPTPEALLLAVDAKLAQLGMPTAVPRIPPGRPAPAGLGAARLVVRDPDRSRLEQARRVVATGLPYDDDDITFTSRGLLTTKGKVALLMPETSPAGPEARSAPLRPLARWAGLDGPIGDVAPAAVLDVAFQRLGLRADAVVHPAAGAWRSTATDGIHDFAPLARRLHEEGVRAWVESGPGHLQDALADALGDRPHTRVATLSPDHPLLVQADRVLARLWVEGADVAPDALHQPLPHDSGSAATQREIHDAPAVHPGLRAVVGPNG